MTSSKRFVLGVTCATVFCCSWATPTLAQSYVPAAIPIQGFLADSRGNPIDRPNLGVEMRFRLFTSERGGSELYLDVQTVPVIAGRFVASLGDTTPLPLEIFRDNAQIWVQIEVNGDSELPRFRLGTVPFSAAAEHAHRMDWTGLTGVPAGLDDGDDFLTRPTVEDFARGVCFDTRVELTSALNGTYLREGSTLTCGDSQKVRGVDRNTGNFLCAPDADTNTLYSAATGGGLTLVGNAFSLATAGVTRSKIAKNSVDSSKVVDGSVNTADLAEGAVTQAKIKDGSINTAKIDNEAVSTAKIANEAVTAPKLNLREGSATRSESQLGTGTHWLFAGTSFATRSAACHVSVYAQSPAQPIPTAWSITVARRLGTGPNTRQEAAGPSFQALKAAGGAGMVASGSWRIPVNGEQTTFGARIDGIPAGFVGPLDLSVTYLCI